ncbi:anaphase promoting complex subunit 10 (APC10), putative [Paecilomyces variotii No. 5]|uniref:Anaphase promoting complex subunit 10 (APC10), putative n=1 Tax=Byssochlamys spectabilis (strain No. 5 / NBRC 109023) TaxID=1356009 RepID=V5FUH8_BYSSN|nr:anaphase promoting complex subunit 10 (APC10), putative [Paecilomyces variotii No. 5]
MPRHPILRRPPDARPQPARARSDFQTPPPRNAADVMHTQLGQSPIPYESAAAMDPRRVAAMARFQAGQPEDTDQIEAEEMGAEVDEELEMEPEGQMEHEVDPDGEGEMEGEREMGEEDEDFEGQEEDEDEEMRDRNQSPSPLPPNLREISSLASWTVSTHKPGCGVAALRHPSPSQFWQSDGPQPHTLTLHFFKLVAVVKIRVYLDFELDESYTPTKMVFLAGMGGNDLVEFASWEGEGPCGWVDIPLEGVGGSSGGWGDAAKKRRRRKNMHKSKSQKNHRDDILSDESDAAVNHDETTDSDDSDDPASGNILKAMVLQVRVCENHQNGKDTHVRGFQVFARDEDRKRVAITAAAAGAHSRRNSVRKSLHGGKDAADHDRPESSHGIVGGSGLALEDPDWMGEAVIR